MKNLNESVFLVLIIIFFLLCLYAVTFIVLLLLPFSNPFTLHFSALICLYSRRRDGAEIKISELIDLFFVIALLIRILFFVMLLDMNLLC